MVAVLLTASPEHKAWPGLAEAADLTASAVRIWCQAVADAGWRGLAALSTAGAVLGLLAGILFAAANPPLPAAETNISAVGPGHAVRSLAVLLRSHRVLAEAARLTRPGISPADLKKQLQVSADPPDQSVWIRVHARTTAQAVSAANAVADTVLFHEPHPDADYIADGAWVVSGESARNLVKTSGLGALCGALLAAILTATLHRPGRRYRIT